MKITSLRINGLTVSRLSINGRAVSLGQEPVSCDALCFTAQEPGSTVKLTKNGDAPNVNLQTSTDGNSWTPYNVEDTITLTNVGDKVYFKAVGSNSTMGTSFSDYNKFVMTGKIAASGNVNSLLEEDEQTARTMSLSSKTYCYGFMFYECTSLTQAPELPATTLADLCYQNMFQNCSSLTQAPVLPATTLGTECYENMFYNCTSLTQAPVLPATTLADYCYISMFGGCSSLTQAPELPATTLADSCYLEMFQNCTNLNYVKVGFTNWDTNATENWLPQNTGNFECPQALIDNTTTRTTSTVPESWTMVAV